MAIPTKSSWEGNHRSFELNVWICPFCLRRTTTRTSASHSWLNSKAFRNKVSPRRRCCWLFAFDLLDVRRWIIFSFAITRNCLRLSRRKGGYLKLKSPRDSMPLNIFLYSPWRVSISLLRVSISLLERQHWPRSMSKQTRKKGYSFSGLRASAKPLPCGLLEVRQGEQGEQSDPWVINRDQSEVKFTQTKTPRWNVSGG